MRETGTQVTQADTSHFPAVQRVLYQGVAYRLGHQIAVGASSTVFEASDEWGNLLAAKRYHEGNDDSEWRREAENLRRLRHPRIVHLHAAFEHEGSRYLILERAGPSLARAKLAGPAERDPFARFAARFLMEGLHAIHAAGYIHGDVASGNVLATLDADARPVGVKLCDFALCRAANGTAPARVCAWNPPPEHYEPARFGAITQAMDIYHASLVLLELLVTELPVFSEADIVGGKPRQFALDQGLPLANVLAKGMAPRASERPAAIALWREVARLGKPE